MDELFDAPEDLQPWERLYGRGLKILGVLLSLGFAAYALYASAPILRDPVRRNQYAHALLPHISVLAGIVAAFWILRHGELYQRFVESVQKKYVFRFVAEFTALFAAYLLWSWISATLDELARRAPANTASLSSEIACMLLTAAGAALFSGHKSSANTKDEDQPL